MWYPRVISDSLIASRLDNCFAPSQHQRAFGNHSHSCSIPLLNLPSSDKTKHKRSTWGETKRGRPDEELACLFHFMLWNIKYLVYNNVKWPGPELWCRDGFSVCFVVYGFEILIFGCRLIRLSGLAGWMMVCASAAFWSIEHSYAPVHFGVMFETCCLQAFSCVNHRRRSDEMRGFTTIDILLQHQLVCMYRRMWRLCRCHLKHVPFFWSYWDVYEAFTINSSPPSCDNLENNFNNEQRAAADTIPPVKPRRGRGLKQTVQTPRLLWLFFSSNISKSAFSFNQTKTNKNKLVSQNWWPVIRTPPCPLLNKSL